MSVRISADHPIRELFGSMVERAFRFDAELSRPPLPRYVADLLVEFSSMGNVFRLRDASGKMLEDVGEMLLEGDISLNATSFEREREVHKHIGDFALFWTGVYPEMLRELRHVTRRDHLIDYVEQGRKSYHIASTFAYGNYAEEAPVLRRLSERFESCALGLRRVREDMEGLREPSLFAPWRPEGSSIH